MLTHAMPTRETGKQTRSFIEMARRSQIIEAAIETIAEVGHPNASLAQIAQRLGISKGVISYHFATKDELVGEIVTEILAMGGRFMAPRLTAEKTARGQLRAYIESNLEFMAINRIRIVALISIILSARTPEGKMVFDAYSNESVLHWTEEIFREGQKSGEFREFAIRPMAIALRGVIDAAPGKFLADPNFDWVGYAHELVHLFDLGTRKKD